MFQLLPSAISAVALQTGSSVLALTCAAFPVALSEADLVARYGREHVVSAQVFGADDPPQDGTVVFRDVPDSRLEIVWQNASRTAPRWIKAVGSRWTTADGITTGMTLQAVERINGRPFRLAGFHTEASGSVRSWANGRIGRLTDPEDCDIRVHFQPRDNGKNNQALVRQLRFGREYSSGHPALQELNPRVVVIWLILGLNRE